MRARSPTQREIERKAGYAQNGTERVFLLMLYNVHIYIVYIYIIRKDVHDGDFILYFLLVSSVKLISS